uniref:Uncharacterized protein n=1 Tax=Escherichia coli TaxID=562 RepID=A0A0G4E6G5_ECOLX|nr:hypothetical protein pEC012_00006 [Escherichia coli]AVE22881.1 hypothetical protein [Escherichia coli]AVN57954.1 hypothetical protein pEC014_00006 [Escherichia coli]QID21579.1 hypothetical protein pEC014_00006 [Escherichia coli]CEL26083.1 Hypothetical protein [Escherichia coli]
MELKWTSKVLSYLARLYDFLVLPSKPGCRQNGVVPDTGSGYSVNSSTYGMNSRFSLNLRKADGFLQMNTKSVTNLLARLFMYCACGTRWKTDSDAFKTLLAKPVGKLD